MKIALIGQKGIPAHYGGVERHVHDLAVRLAQNHNVTAYSRAWYTTEKHEEYKGIRVIHTPTLHTKHLDAIIHTFTSTIHALFQGYDVIHYHGVGPALLSWIPRIFAPRTKVVNTFHSIDRYHKKWGWFAKWVLKIGERAACFFAHDTITISQSLQQYCFNEYRTHTEYIPNGVEMPVVPTGTKTLDVFGLKKDEYFVMVSRLVAHKGAHLLIEAFHNLKRNHPNDPIVQNMKLAIVGGSVYTDDYIRQLHTQASQLSDIVFTDFQSGEALDELYGHATALVHPSLNEGLPITVLNAMSYEKATLLSAIPEHIELTQNPLALFRENDVNAIEQSMYQYLNLPYDAKRELGKENKQTIKDSYVWECLVPQILHVYERNRKKKKQTHLKHVTA